MTRRTEHENPCHDVVPRHYKHREIADAAKVRKLVTSAERLIVSDSDSTHRAAQETLFKAMHGCAEMMAKEVARKSPSCSRLKMWRRRYDAIAEHLVNTNIGLVYEMRRRTRVFNEDEDEYVSAGMWALYQSVVAFDPWRGFRFSTYACNAIIRGYLHVNRVLRRRHRLNQELMDQAKLPQTESEPAANDVALLADRLNMILEQRTAELTAIERFVLQRRYLHSQGKRETLESLGRLLRLSKERVRQIQNVAIDKLRDTLGADDIAASLSMPLANAG